MPANHLPYFPLHVDDYLNDPVVAAMDADAEGCYISLLLRAWKLPEPGVVPEWLVEELGRLHRITDFVAPDTHEGFIDSAGNGQRRREEVLRQLRAAFDTESRPGFWVQKRMVLEYAKARRLLEGRERGGRNRWAGADLKESFSSPRGDLKDTTSYARLGVDVDSTETEEATRTEHSTNGKSTESEKSRRASVREWEIPDWLPRSVWIAWCEFRETRPKRSNWTEAAAKLSLKKLIELRGLGHDPQRVVDESILNSWVGLFDPRTPLPAKSEAKAEDEEWRP